MVNHKTPRFSAAFLLFTVFVSLALGMGTLCLFPSAVSGESADGVPSALSAGILSDDGENHSGTDQATGRESEPESTPMEEGLRPHGRSADGNVTDGANGAADGGMGSDSTSWVIGTIIVALLLIAVAIVIIALLPRGKETRRGGNRPDGGKE